MAVTNARIVDYHEATGEAMGHYVDWLKARGYKGTDILPQDDKVREFTTGRTRLGALYAMDREPQLGIPHSCVDGINAVRVIIVAAHFDAVRCAKGIEALRHHQAGMERGKRASTVKRRGMTGHRTPRIASDTWRSHGARRSCVTSSPRTLCSSHSLTAR